MRYWTPTSSPGCEHRKRRCPCRNHRLECIKNFSDQVDPSFTDFRSPLCLKRGEQREARQREARIKDAPFENSDRTHRRPTVTQSASGGHAHRWEHSAQIAAAAKASDIRMNPFDRVRRLSTDTLRLARARPIGKVVYRFHIAKVLLPRTRGGARVVAAEPECFCGRCAQMDVNVASLNKLIDTRQLASKRAASNLALEGELQPRQRLHGSAFARPR